MKLVYTNIISDSEWLQPGTACCSDVVDFIWLGKALLWSLFDYNEVPT